MAMLYDDHRGHTGNLSECRLLDVKQWSLVGSWLNGEHLLIPYEGIHVHYCNALHQTKKTGIQEDLADGISIFILGIHRPHKFFKASKYNTIYFQTSFILNKNVFIFLIYKLLIRISPTQVLDILLVLRIQLIRGGKVK